MIRLTCPHRTQYASTVAALLTSIDHLLGFRPEDSLVITFLRADRAILTARVDWPWAFKRPEGVAERVVTLRERVAAESALLVLCGPTTAPQEQDERLDAVADRVVARVPLLGAVQTEARRWWTSDCYPDCGFRTHEVAELSARILRRSEVEGRLPAERRTDLAAEFTPASKSEVAAVARSIAKVDQTRSSLLDHAYRSLCGSADLDDVHVAQLALTCAEVITRDDLLFRLVDDPLAPWWFVQKRAALAGRRTPAGYRAGLVTLAGFAAWQAGDGVRAMLALDVALESSPDYQLARLVRQAIGTGMPPSWFEARMWRRDRRS